MTAVKSADWDNLFRSYDIRGIFGEQLTAEDAETLGMAISIYQGKNSEMIVGRDVRLSGEALKEGLEKGLTYQTNVLDIGVVSTPMLYFATNYVKKAGVMITASHNPAEWNGFKLFKPLGAIFGEEMTKIKQIAKTAPDNKTVPHIGTINIVKEIFQDYANFISKKIKVQRNLTVVADTANGVCGLFAPTLFKQQGCSLVTINEEPDGHFPAHKPEPKEENLGEVMSKVVKMGADFGVGYDGDGDRVVFVDDKGRVIPGDLALAILAQDTLSKNKGAPIVFELSCSMAVEEIVKKYGGVPIVERVGHTFIMDRMIKEKAPLGGEKSGHFYFSETYGGDDAIFASLKMAELLSRNKKKLSEMFDDIPKYPSVFEENFKSPDEKKFAVIEKLKAVFEKKGLSFLREDGIKLVDKNGWVLMRASNTEPIIRVSAEARTTNKLDELYGFAKEQLTQVMEN